MTVHVGIVIYQTSRGDLARCLESVFAQTYQPVTIALWDNSPTDTLTQWIQATYPQLACIHTPTNIGFGRAHNALIQTAHLQPDDFYLALNPDAWLAADYIEQVVSVLEQDACIGWGVGKLRLAEQPRQLYSAGHAQYRDGYVVNIGLGLADEADFDQVRPVWGASGAAVLYKAALIRDISQAEHFFDPTFFLYGEDTDIDWRARRRGWVCWYVPMAVGYHHLSQPPAALQTHAVANRYLSVIKNAAWSDLVFYHAPIIGFHLLMRLCLTPYEGLRLNWLFGRGVAAAWRARTPDQLPPAERHTWWTWSQQQATSQPQTWQQRILARLKL